MNDTPAPRRKDLLQRWHIDIRWRAYGLLSFQADGTLSNSALADGLGIDARTLCDVLSRDPHFVKEIRWQDGGAHGGRGHPWWRVDPLLKAPPKPELPKLLAAPRNPHRVAALPCPT